MPISAAGFELRYDTALRVMQVHRGEFFDTDDPFLAISPRGSMFNLLRRVTLR